MLSTAPCGIVRELKAFLSADGTHGLVVWKATAIDQQTLAVTRTEVRMVTFDWDPGLSAPLSVTPGRTFVAISGVNNIEAALSADGSRAVVEYIADFADAQIAYYAVIDMEHPDYTQLQSIPFDPFNNYPRFKVAISADGEVIALSAFRTTGSFGNGGFREFKIFTCQANCYRARLKTFSGMLPVSQGGSALDLDLNDSGSRLVATWSRVDVPIVGTTAPARALRMLVLSPISAALTNNVTASVQYVNNAEIARDSFDLSPDGARFAFATDHPDMWNHGSQGFVRVTTGTLSSAGRVGLTTTSNVTSTSGPFVDLQMTGSPERVFLTMGMPGNQFGTYVSDSLAMKYWSVASTASDPAAYVSVAVSSQGSRSVTSYDVSNFQNQTTQPVIKVTALKSVLGATVAPSVSGAPVVGKTLTIKNGSWNATGTFGYHWFADGWPIAGEDGPSYALQQADAGKRITVEVTHTKSGYYDRVVTTAATAVVTGGIISAPDLVITGVNSGINNRPIVRDLLRVDTSLWTPHNGTFTYVWKVGTKIVSTSATYIPVLADLGKRITVTISQTIPGFTKLTKTSPVTEPVIEGR
jgi:hypothetical protein